MAKPKVEWSSEVPDLSGVSQYVIMIRSRLDPERTGRGKVSATAWRAAAKSPVEQWEKEILRALSDCVPRTFHRLAVEIANIEGDTAAGKNPETAIWNLARAGKVEHTWQAPIYWRKTGCKADPPPEPPKPKPAPGHAAIVGPEPGEPEEPEDEPEEQAPPPPSRPRKPAKGRKPPAAAPAAQAPARRPSGPRDEPRCTIGVPCAMVDVETGARVGIPATTWAIEAPMEANDRAVLALEGPVPNGKPGMVKLYLPWPDKSGPLHAMAKPAQAFVEGSEIFAATDTPGSLASQAVAPGSRVWRRLVVAGVPRFDRGGLNQDRGYGFEALRRSRGTVELDWRGSTVSLPGSTIVVPTVQQWVEELGLDVEVEPLDIPGRVILHGDPGSVTSEAWLLGRVAPGTEVYAHDGEAWRLAVVG